MDTIDVMLDDGAFAPERAHSADAGFDIRTPIPFTVKDGGSYTVGTGVHISIPEGYVGFLKSKSGLNVYDGITGEGVIDAGYTGAIVVKLYNNGYGDKEFRRGDKIIQLVILPVATPRVKIVESFEKTERGNDGFGSTGR